MRILQGTQQHLGVADGVMCLGKTHAAGIGEFQHFGQGLAPEAHGQRAQRVQVRQPHVVGAVFEHFHETRFVQWGIGVRRAGQ